MFCGFSWDWVLKSGSTMQTAGRVPAAASVKKLASGCLAMSTTRSSMGYSSAVAPRGKLAQ